ncbi:hypothetical protein BH10BAC2_BH10BAC2_14450 [soil metagenome]
MKKLTIFFFMALYALTSNAQTTGDYRSIVSGNWNAIATWQRYNGTGWVAAVNFPTSSDGAITIRDGDIVTIGSYNLTLDQVKVDGGAQLTITSSTSYTVTLENGVGDDLVVNGYLNFTGGNIAGTGRLSVAGNMRWENGYLTAPATNKGSISIVNSVRLYSILTNQGTLNWVGGHIYFYGGTITNTGAFNCHSNGYLDVVSISGTINNNAGGIFNVSVLTTLTNQTVFYNRATMNFNSGTFYNTGTFTNSKSMNFSSGTSVFQNGTTANLNIGTTITGTGTIHSYDGTIYFNLETILPSTITLLQQYASGVLGGSGSITVNGKFMWDDGTVSVPVTVSNTGSILIIGSSAYLSSTITNNGTITWTYGNINFNGGNIINNKTFNILNDYQLYKSTAGGTFTNGKSGVVTKSSFGTTTVGIPFTNSGKIKGTGAFAFGVNLTTNTGTFEPGIGAATGILTTGTNYKNKKLSIRMNDSIPGLGFDRLVVNGNVTFGADTLTVIASDSIPPGAYTIVSYTGTKTGVFKVKNLPANFTVTYPANKVVVNVPDPGRKIAATPQENNIVKSAAAIESFGVFPNPAKKSISINYQPKNNTATLQVLDISGKPVLQKTLSQSNISSIDISTLAAGSYFLQITDGTKKLSSQFIKQ